MYASGDTPPVYKIRLKAADGSGEAKEFLNGLDATFSPDGKFIVYAAPEQAGQQNWGSVVRRNRTRSETFAVPRYA